MDANDSTGRPELLAHLRQLYIDLYAVIERDPEQEVLGVALPVLDCVMSAARHHLATGLPGVGLTAAMVDLISPRTVEQGVPVRALDTWLVVGQVLAALGVAGDPLTTPNNPVGAYRTPMFTP